MTDHFDKWINSMSDDEYSDWLDAPYPIGASDAQEEKALNIREQPLKEEQEQLEELQEFTEPEPQEELEAPTGEQTQEPIQEPRRRGIFSSGSVEIQEGVTSISQPVGEPIQVKRVGERITMIREPSVPIQSLTPPPVQPTITPPVPPRPSGVSAGIRNAVSSAGIRNAVSSAGIRNAVSSAGRFFRRFFRV